MINDLIKNYSHNNAENVDYYPVSYRDSENHDQQNGDQELFTK